MKGPDLGRLRWRLLVANLAVAAAGAAAVAVGVWLAAPRAFENAMGFGGMMGSGGMMGGGSGNAGGTMDPVVRAAFGDAVGTALALGLVAAVIVAVVVATVLSARIARPVTEPAAASERVAHGDYSGRVPPATGEIGDLATSFNAMAAALEATEQRRRDLIGDVAHELRTPIASVRGYVEGLEAGVIAAGPDAWRVLDEQTARLSHLVDDLSLLWQADSRDLRLQVEILDGPGLLADARERHRALAAERAVSLSLGHVAPVSLLADRTRIGQVLDNLVGNALRYTPAGGRVELGLAAVGPSALITVRDDGPGLTPEQAGRVFDRFYRADPSRSREAGGSGLGLAITQSLVEAMDGSIEVASPGPGAGATFAVRLARA
jgi:two-component system, OmpR family, sensor histidine kinase BaeS